LKIIHLLKAQILCSLTFAGISSAQPLPKIEFQQVFTNLQIDRLVWMSEAPDGSARFFAVGQAGKILVFKKDSDGSDAKEFLNIEDRHPYFENEDGLMSIAFHPGFKTNGLFYIYYNQKNPADQNLKPQNYPFRSVISEFRVSTNDPGKADMSSERIVLEVPQPFWNHKGGQLTFGPDGYLYLGDRLADMILRGGANIYPAEVEAAVSAHPDVRSCVVVGLPDPEFGQRVHAILELTEAADAPSVIDGIGDFLADRLSRYKHPESFEVVSVGLRDDAGKVRRTLLRDERAAWLTEKRAFRIMPSKRSSRPPRDFKGPP